jgi:hypothetical protein
MKGIFDRPRYLLEETVGGRFYSIKEIKFLSNVLNLNIDQIFKWKKGVFLNIKHVNLSISNGADHPHSFLNVSNIVIF